jgi:RHS repeat-associated protein
MQGAGGVGGLLMVRHGGQSYVPLMDGNGNVMGLQGLGGAKDGQTVARYDYDAFGNRITNTAPELGEDVCPFGFSTKLTDGETGLVYYGYRYYSPELGCWVSRDPIGERGGINLYGMVGNDAVNRWDYLGMLVLSGTLDRWQDIHGNIVWSDGTKVAVRSVSELAFELNSRGHCDCVKSLHVMGHGSRETMQLGQNDILQVDKYVGGAYRLNGIDVSNAKEVDLTKVLHFCENGALVLDGCNTAREWPWDDNNITRDASNAFPGTMVYGNRGIGIGILPLSENVYGFTRCYKSGQQSNSTTPSNPSPAIPLIPLGY